MFCELYLQNNLANICNARNHIYGENFKIKLCTFAQSTGDGLGLPPGGVLGLKTDGGVPLAAENWTQKDQGKNWIWGQKDRFL